MASVDLLMYLSTYFVVGLQYLCKWGSWNGALPAGSSPQITSFLFVIFYMYLTETSKNYTGCPRSSFFAYLVLLMKNAFFRLLQWLSMGV
nr:CMF_HP1_G0048310.mRNA.1.CDS.1 [Saccharomyces cerevisiae]